MRRESIPGNRNGLGKGFKAELLVCFRKRQEVSVAGVEKAMGRVVGNEPMGRSAGPSSRVRGRSIVRTLPFTLVSKESNNK